MGADLIHREADCAVQRSGGRDPFALLDALGVICRRSDAYGPDGLKGYCLLVNRVTFVVLNAALPPQELRLVAAHEAGHVLLHRALLQRGPLRDLQLDSGLGRAEYEANLFAADFLLADETVTQAAGEANGDFYALAGLLEVHPELLGFKLQSLNRRGGAYRLPQPPRSRFLRV